MKISNELKFQLKAAIKAHVLKKYKTHRAAAAAWGCRDTYVAKVISGDRPPLDVMMVDAGITLIIQQELK